MNTHRLNITLPEDLADRLKNLPNKSSFIAEALREKLGAVDSERMAGKLAEAYRESVRENAKVTEEWDALSGEAIP